MVTLTEALILLGELRALGAEMPMAQAFALLLIARDEGLSLKDLAHRADIGMATASRYVAAFGPTGLNLVQAKEDPEERRKKIITLTPKGRATVKRILGER